MNKSQLWATIAVTSLCTGILILLTDVEEDVIDLVKCNQVINPLKRAKKSCS